MLQAGALVEGAAEAGGGTAAMMLACGGLGDGKLVKGAAAAT
jgi:hypothetical protein